MRNNAVIGLLIFVLVISGCSQPIRVMTTYKNSTADLDKFKRTNYECETTAAAMAQISNNSSGKAITGNVLANIDPVLYVLALPFILVDYGGPTYFEIERNRCLSANGYDPLIQFVGSKDKTFTDFGKSIEVCNAKLNDTKLIDKLLNDHNLVNSLLDDDPKIDISIRENVDNFVYCLAQNGWLIIMQPPWFIDGQKISKPPRFIPRGEWKYVSDNPESVAYRNVTWEHKISENIYRTKIIFTKKDEMNPNISISYIDVNCADGTLRESKRRGVEKEPWKPVLPDTVGFFLKDKVCAGVPALTQR